MVVRAGRHKRPERICDHLLAMMNQYKIVYPKICKKRIESDKMKGV